MSRKLDSGAHVVRVTDQSVLADVAKNDKAHDVRKTAVGRVTDQSVLADIAKNDKDCDMRTIAAARIAYEQLGQATLADLGTDAERL